MNAKQRRTRYRKLLPVMELIVLHAELSGQTAGSGYAAAALRSDNFLRRWESVVWALHRQRRAYGNVWATFHSYA